MNSHSQRLQQLNLDLPAVPAPVASYIPALRDGEIVYTSGQLPFVDGKLPQTGVVGEGEGLVSPEDAAELARVAVLNAIAAAANVAGGIDNIERVIKLTGFVASATAAHGQAFTGQPAVINGASDLLGKVFGDAGQHARSAVGVAALPAGAPVELELIVKVR